MNIKVNKEKKVNYNSGSNVVKFIFFSLIGVFMFFVPVTINGGKSIPLEHLVSYVTNNYQSVGSVYALIIILFASIYPFITKTWKKDKTTLTFTIFKIFGAVITLLVFFNIGPEIVLNPHFGPFLFKALAVQVGLLVPIGAVFLTFIMNYGFVDLIGVLLRPITVPIWNTPGRSAVDAVASFMASTAVGILITNGVYKEKKYTTKEACIIATGFSTVCITFTVVVAKTLDLMEVWNEFFLLSLFVTFAVTAITVRLKPLKTKPDSYYMDEPGFPENDLKGNLIVNAVKEGLRVSSEAGTLKDNIVCNVKNALHLILEILPNLMSIGLAGLLLAEFTPVFDYLGYIFYPITYLLRMPEPLLAAKAVSLGIAEMFLPALIVVGSTLTTRFIIGIVCITEILMFSCTIPCIIATEIPITVKELVVIWFERTVISLLIAAPIAYILL